MTEIARIALEKLDEGSALRVEADPEAICVVRIGGTVYAVSDRCSHANVSLSEGEVDPEERTIECWKHGSTFSLLDGCPQSLPATQPVRTYRAEVEGDEIVVSEL